MSISIREARDLLLESPERLGEYKKGNLKSRKANYLFNYENDRAASSNDTNKVSIAQARKLLTEIY